MIYKINSFLNPPQHSLWSESVFKSNFKSKIQDHLGWIGTIPGLDAEKMLRGQAAYRYVLRTGESDNNYYVTFSHPDGSIRHQPITISTTPKGWCCENGAALGPFMEEVTIDDIIHLIMHCEKGKCEPLPT